ncbi:hypothetical protein MSAN_02489200 [Mycena sanguinolenta]|uniref:Uncharacterized protein n=1 Tax=Mycena sanguinolenta TaxID=230812 RepID=A0A8H6WRD6_9AGAR|nr:hypothetical protein MSAN_02489200 [Mycena sanguinolenta]
MTEQPPQPSSAQNLRVHRGPVIKPVIIGGVGGDGGSGSKRGGHGGVGEGATMDLNDASYFAEIIGGRGGKGGMGEIGGNGGRRRRSQIYRRKTYEGRARVRRHRPRAGYENVGGLLEATKGDLQGVGLQYGEVNQLKDALNKYALAHPFKT